MNYEIEGVIYSIGEIQKVSDKFSKREMVLYVENPTNKDWSDYIKVELQQDRVDLTDPYNKRDKVKVHINLRGRIWNSPKGEEVVFNTIVVWKIEPVATAPQTGKMAPPPTPLDEVMAEAEPTDDLPF